MPPLPSDVTTRIDQLTADLRRHYSAQVAAAAAPSPAPLFTEHHDGTVTDRAGTILRGPAQR
jgi:hypothetical protein